MERPFPVRDRFRRRRRKSEGHREWDSKSAIPLESKRPTNIIASTFNIAYGFDRTNSTGSRGSRRDHRLSAVEVFTVGEKQDYSRWRELKTWVRRIAHRFSAETDISIILAAVGVIWGFALGLMVNIYNVRNVPYLASIALIGIPGQAYSQIVRILYQPLIMLTIVHFTVSLWGCLLGIYLSIAFLSIIFVFFGGFMAFGWNRMYWVEGRRRLVKDLVNTSSYSPPNQIIFQPQQFYIKDTFESLLPISMIRTGFSRQLSVVEYDIYNDLSRRWDETKSSPAIGYFPNDIGLIVAFITLGLVASWVWPMGRIVQRLVAQSLATFAPFFRNILKPAPFFLFVLSFVAAMDYPVPFDVVVDAYGAVLILFMLSFSLTLVVLLPMLDGMCTFSNPLKSVSKYPLTCMFALAGCMHRLTLPVFMYETLLASAHFEERSTRDFFIFHSFMNFLLTRVGDCIDYNVATGFFLGMLGRAVPFPHAVVLILFSLQTPWLYQDQLERIVKDLSAGRDVVFQLTIRYVYGHFMHNALSSNEVYMQNIAQTEALARYLWYTHKRIALIGNILYVIFTSHLCTMIYDSSIIARLVKLTEQQLGAHESLEQE